MEIFYPGRGKCMDEDLPQSAEVLGKLGFCVGWGPDAVFQLSNYLEGVAAELTRYGYALEIADRAKPAVQMGFLKPLATGRLIISGEFAHSQPAQVWQLDGN